MVLKALAPPPKVGLAQGWELIASEAGRSSKGLTFTIGLFNGTAQRFRTVALADSAAQQALAGEFAALTGLTPEDIAHAFAALVVAVEGGLRQDTQDAKAPAQATRLVEMALDAGVELFHTPDGEAYGTIAVDSHYETWPLKVKVFRRWLARLFYEAEEKSPSAQALQDTLGVLEGKALFDGPVCAVYTRLAAHNDAIYLDLADAHWQAVEVTTDGWCVVDTPPVKFRRSRGMAPLPPPDTGGTLTELRRFVNIGSEQDWRLLVAWFVAALRPTGPYPILILHGEQGSAKSTVVRLMRALVDPNEAALRTTPRDERDLMIAATNGHCLALDNLSYLPEWLSDALCRIATGGGFATRELYTDAEEAIFSAQRPIVLNGIEELATRGDLLDRAIVLDLPSIQETTRRHEADFWRDFEHARPRLLGAALDIVSAALRALPTTHLPRLPRMADFALWSCAAAPACGWTAADFLDAYTGARAAAYDLTLDASLVAGPLRTLAACRGGWTGTATELLAALEQRVDAKTAQAKAWPKNGRALSNSLRRLAPTLRAVGIDVVFQRASETTRRRVIRLTTAGPAPAERRAPHGEPRDVEVF
jgi:hypothetical protein